VLASSAGTSAVFFFKEPPKSAFNKLNMATPYKNVIQSFFKTSGFEKASLDHSGKPVILPVFRELFEKLTEFFKKLTYWLP